jgi:hypothetical protein
MVITFSFPDDARRSAFLSEIEASVESVTAAGDTSAVTVTFDRELHVEIIEASGRHGCSSRHYPRPAVPERRWSEKT